MIDFDTRVATIEATLLATLREAPFCLPPPRFGVLLQRVQFQAVKATQWRVVMGTDKKAIWGNAISAAVLYLALAAAANASTVSGWWGGTWTCDIDGRPAKMKWMAVSVVDGECDGETCSQSTSARWKGSFSDNGSRWVVLNNPRPGSKGGLYFNHADGNKWYLPKPRGGRSDGWTTWQGKRYRLSCWR